VRWNNIGSLIPCFVTLRREPSSASHRKSAVADLRAKIFRSRVNPRQIFRSRVNPRSVGDGHSGAAHPWSPRRRGHLSAAELVLDLAARLGLPTMYGIPSTAPKGKVPPRRAQNWEKRDVSSRRCLTDRAEIDSCGHREWTN
jgi:hypothetical protein